RCLEGVQPGGHDRRHAAGAGAAMKGRSWRPWRWVVPPDPRKEVDEELRFHLEQRTRDYVERGMSPESARQAAAQRFGDAARVRDACAPMLARDRAAEARRTRWGVSLLCTQLVGVEVI